MDRSDILPCPPDFPPDPDPGDADPDPDRNLDIADPRDGGFYPDWNGALE